MTGIGLMGHFLLKLFLGLANFFLLFPLTASQ